MDYKVYRLTRKEHILYCLGLGGLGFILSILFYDSLIPSIGIVFLYKRGRKEVEKVLCQKQQRLLREQFCDFLTSVSSFIATGHHMRDAIEGAGEALASVYEEDSLIQTEIRTMLNQMDCQGIREPQAVAEFADRSGIPEVRQFSQTFLICRETGGDLIAGMEETCRVIREKVSIENEIRRIQSQKKYEGHIIAVMPILIILFLRFSSPEYLDVMYQTFSGRISMSLALGITAGAFVMIERITEIEI